MTELLLAIYFLVGFLIGIWRMSKVTREEQSSMACIGAAFIMMIWPLYLIYKYFKK